MKITEIKNRANLCEQPKTMKSPPPQQQRQEKNHSTRTYDSPEAPLFQ